MKKIKIKIKIKNKFFRWLAGAGAILSLLGVCFSLVCGFGLLIEPLYVKWFPAWHQMEEYGRLEAFETGTIVMVVAFVIVMIVLFFIAGATEAGNLLFNNFQKPVESKISKK